MTPRIILLNPVLVSGAMALAIIAAGATPAQAQDASGVFPNLLLLGVHYGAPERLSGSISGVGSVDEPALISTTGPFPGG